ncbi:response regulator [Thermobifida cellulosilytica]|uniref:LuxR family transcriptional regulator n=1 Tax=Thermobifida cellulosilytica TB100 TaxID=665004 RepID=A0A147KLE9_THECS|nr:response regulator transcription factor [Thermobifida cellulosilytica]KUP98117.1 LuxR family transcriptional regulator [Thermobifida cellulosilytica TB100]
MPRPHRPVSPSVFIVDDHELFSTAVETMLRSRGIPAVRAHSLIPQDVLAQAAELQPSLVLLDLDLGTDPEGRPLDGVSLARNLSRDGWQVLLVTGSTERPRIAEAIAAGAGAWLSKSVPFEELIYAILDGFAGRPMMDPKERQSLLAEHRALQAQRRSTSQMFNQLTKRERQVLDALVEGKRAKVIAAESYVSIATVRSQIRSILAKLNVKSQLEAVALVKSQEG